MNASKDMVGSMIVTSHVTSTCGEMIRSVVGLLMRTCAECCSVCDTTRNLSEQGDASQAPAGFLYLRSLFDGYVPMLVKWSMTGIIGT